MSRPCPYPEVAADPIPGWLEERPSSFQDLPVRQRIQALPFDKLDWPDFERLVLRVVKEEKGVLDCRIYGQRGEKQDGIDLLVRYGSGELACVQCKRVESFGPNDILRAVKEFEEGNWAERAKSFTLCVATSLESTKTMQAIAKGHALLAKRAVEFHIWDASASAGLNAKLKELPAIVEDFFGSAWVEPFNGIATSASHAAATSRRTEAANVADLRINREPCGNPCLRLS